MPPAISDDEVSDIVEPEVSAKKRGRGAKPVAYKEVDDDDFEDEEGNEDDEDQGKFTPAKAVNGAATDEDEGGYDNDDEDLEEDEYIVEKIISHIINDDGEPRFEVKWEGFEKKEDRTWEPEDNLKTNASEILNEYYKSIGGREAIFEQTKKALKTRKRGRQPSAAGDQANKRSRKNGHGGGDRHPSESTPPASAAKAAKEWRPPSGSWDSEIETVDMCQDEDNGNLTIYLTWKNGYKTQHNKEVVYRRCPQKMLRFYERHLRVLRDGESVKIEDVNDES